MPHRYRLAAVRALLATLSLLAACAARAGGSAETTLLVVNADSPLSLAVANEYMRLRPIPEGHVLWLHDVPPLDTIDVDTFRKRILTPIREHLAASGLAREIDLIAYSAGFPYAVNFRSDEEAHHLAKDRYRGDAGSLTGMTFFAHEVLAGDIGYLDRHANRYFHPPQLVYAGAPPSPADATGRRNLPAAMTRRLVFPPTRGFRSDYRWASLPGWQATGGDKRYYLSVMLAYTGLRGNSLPEIDNYLGRAAASDGTRPDGTVYLMENRNIRGRVRSHLFDSTLDALAQRGRHGEILAQGVNGQNGRVPLHKTDIIGLVAGTRGFDWADSGSRLLPGAIAESFTSYGAHFALGTQTKLTEFLRQGAAGSSGAVREPYAFLEKFPLPQLHVYYADGSSLAEAFYQSVAGPYQLLIVGDPLARPFAPFAQVGLAAPETDTPWRGTVAVMPRVAPARGRPIKRVELWIDGRPLASVEPGPALVLDTTRLADGSHDLRLVAIEANPVETRSVARRTIRVDNHGRKVEIAEAADTVDYGSALAVAVDAPGAKRVTVRQGERVLAEAAAAGGRWHAKVDSTVLGPGTATLHVDAEYADGGHARSDSRDIQVTAPPLLAAEPAPAADRQGLTLTAVGADGASTEVTVDGLSGPLPRQLARGEVRQIGASGAFETRAAGLYELTVEAAGELTVKIGADWKRQARIAPGVGGARFAVPLDAGWHRIELELAAADNDALRALLAGPEPAFELSGERVRRP